MQASATFLDSLLFPRWLRAWTPLTFVTGCALIYAALALVISSYFPLIDADSTGYGGRGRQLMLACFFCFFAGTANVYTLLISAINVSTPRFLMAVYPQIVLAGVFLLLAIIPRLANFPPIGRPHRAAAKGSKRVICHG